MVKKLPKKEDEEEVMTPWMTEKEVTFLKKHLRKDNLVFEWGSGGSTIDFSKKVKHYYSIEHNFKWYKKVKDKISQNVNISYVPPNSKDLIWKPPFKEGTYDDFKNYIHAIELVGNFDITFDIIIIDGRARVECANKAFKYLNNDGILFMHDFHRPYYWKILDSYELLDVVGTLALLKKKKNNPSNHKDKAFLIKKFLIKR